MSDVKACGSGTRYFFLSLLCWAHPATAAPSPRHTYPPRTRSAVSEDEQPGGQYSRQFVSPPPAQPGFRTRAGDSPACLSTQNNSPVGGRRVSCSAACGWLLTRAIAQEKKKRTVLSLRDGKIRSVSENDDTRQNHGTAGTKGVLLLLGRRGSMCL